MVTRSIIGILAAIIAVMPLAARAEYVLEPVLVHNKPALMVSTINASGVIGGTFAGEKGFSRGFLLAGRKVTEIAKTVPNDLGYNTPSPGSILRDGTVTGTAPIGVYNGFVWSHGIYRQIFEASHIGAPTGSFVRSNNSGTLVFNDYQGQGQYLPYTGKSAPFLLLSPPCGFPVATSINRTGIVSGTCFSFPDPAIFLYQAGAYTLVTMPDALNITGGFINDSGDLAGAYQSTTSPTRGFIKRGDRIITFGPASPPSSITVNAFSNTRHVAGTYTDTTGALHAFAYHHGQFTDLAPPSPSGHGLQVTGVSDAGDVALNITDTTTGVTTPYIARCQGNSC